WTCRGPVSARHSLGAFLRSVVIGPASIWKPSRGPSSWIWTRRGKSFIPLSSGSDPSPSKGAALVLPIVRALYLALPLWEHAGARIDQLTISAEHSPTHNWDASRPMTGLPLTALG